MSFLDDELKKVADILMDKYRGMNVRFTLEGKAFAGIEAPSRKGMITIELGEVL